MAKWLNETINEKLEVAKINDLRNDILEKNMETHKKDHTIILINHYG